MSEDRKTPADTALPENPEKMDELTDQLSDSLTMISDKPPTRPTPGEGELEVVLEEERVKDEIEIQIDLLRDPDWAVRREAVITLGEMGDERCV